MSSGEGKDYGKYFVAGVVCAIVLDIIFFIYVLPCNDRGGSLTVSGFSMLKPQFAWTGMTADGRFTGVFINGAGKTIRVSSEDNIRIRSQDKDIECRGVVEESHEVISGDSFKIIASNCTKYKVLPGDMYEIIISIPFELEVGDKMEGRGDMGTLRGAFE